MDMQAIIDMSNDQAQLQRAQTQMTLGELIARLERQPSNSPILGMQDECCSYRGYYCDLAFRDGGTTAGKLLDLCRSVLGTTLTGYKGGEFLMTKVTPVWVAAYGETGQALMDFRMAGTALVAETSPDNY